MHAYKRPPFTKGGKVTRNYSTHHRGKDIVPRLDDPGDVVAVEGGTVCAKLSGQAAGDDNPNMVVVRGTDGAFTVYGHVSPAVLVGQSISRGDVLGSVDMSGKTTGLHVHLARLVKGDGSIDDVLTRNEKEGANFTISMQV